jgi:hypothetical protein
LRSKAILLAYILDVGRTGKHNQSDVELAYLDFENAKAELEP